MKKILATITATILLGTTAHAANLSTAPTNMEDAAQDYIEQRLEDATGARISAISEPYRVQADLDGKGAAAHWAIDMRLKTRFASGQTGRDTLTVLFYGDEPVALRRDLTTRVTRLDDPVRFAGK